jgi:ABC-type Zn2+ transport system substrate-binding protein/surface adhesin
LENKAINSTSKPKAKDLNKIREEVKIQTGNVCCKFWEFSLDGAIETVAKSVEAGGSLRMLYKRE